MRRSGPLVFGHGKIVSHTWVQKSRATPRQAGDEYGPFDSLSRDSRLAHFLRLESQQIRKKSHDVPTGGETSNQAQIRLGRGTSGEEAAQWLNEAKITEITVSGFSLGAGNQVLQTQRTAQYAYFVSDCVRDAKCG
jgi:hypothetical protein